MSEILKPEIPRHMIRKHTKKYHKKPLAPMLPINEGLLAKG